MSSMPAENSPAEEKDSKPNIPELMAEIRERIKTEVKDVRPKFAAEDARFSQGQSRKAGELLYSEELRYLNHHYGYGAAPDLNSIQSHRGGIIGKIIVKCKRRLMRLIWDSLLKDYFVAEREFQANVVRYLNDIAKYVDARDASNFWELVRKIDVDVTRALERIERIQDEHSATLRSFERNGASQINAVRRALSEIKTVQNEDKNELSRIDTVVRGVEGILANLDSLSSTDVTTAAQTAATKRIPPLSYLLLENRYRGSEQEISKRLEIYPELLQKMPGKILELGPGRGELQALLRSAAIQSYGVDTDRAMVKVSTQKGFEVLEGDGIAHLRTLDKASLGGVIAIQVVEHLSKDTLEELCALCKQKVAPGGRVIFETINPQSVMALSSNYFRDPTHVWPLHPDTLSYMLSLAGLQVLEVRRLSPVGEGASLKKIEAHEFMTPRWKETIDLMNRNVEQLNNLLYGYQDYCVVAEVR